MAVSLPIPAPLAAQGWKLKVRDRETVEPPHVTLVRRTEAWRWDLRSRSFMDHEPDPRAVPEELVDHLRALHEELVKAWDEHYPLNPVGGVEEAE